MSRQKLAQERVELNAAVQALAKISRPAAEKILARFDVLTTASLKSEDVPAAQAAFIEALSKIASTP